MATKPKAGSHGERNPEITAIKRNGNGDSGTILTKEEITMAVKQPESTSLFDFPSKFYPATFYTDILDLTEPKVKLDTVAHEALSVIRRQLKTTDEGEDS